MAARSIENVVLVISLRGLVLPAAPALLAVLHPVVNLGRPLTLALRAQRGAAPAVAEVRGAIVVS